MSKKNAEINKSAEIKETVKSYKYLAQKTFYLNGGETKVDIGSEVELSDFDTINTLIKYNFIKKLED